MATSNVQIVISAVDKATTGIKGVGRQLEGFAQRNNANFKKMAGVGTAAVGGLVAGLSAMTTSLGQNADRLLDLQAITGISTNTLQEFQHITRAAGVDNEAFARATRGISARFKDMEKEGSNVNIAMNKLGITIRDTNGEIRSADDVLLDSIKSLSEVGNELERNSLANELFGRSYEDLIPIMALGGEEIEKLREEAHKLGIVMGEDDLNAANELRIAKENLNATFSAVKNNIAMAVIPIFQELFAKLQPIISSVSIWIKENEDLTRKIIIATGAIAGIIAIAGTLGLTILPLVAGIKTLIVTVKALGVALMFLAANPIGMVITAIAAGIAIGILIMKNWEKIEEKATQLGDKLSEIGKHIYDVWFNIGVAISQAIRGIKESIVTNITGAKDQALLLWNDMWNGITNIMDIAVEWLTGKFQGLKDFIEGIIGFATGAFDRITSIGESASRIAGNIGSGISNAASNVGNFVTGQRALGGPVQGGRTYLVGERGPELFTPGSSGQVRTGTNGGGITINMGGVTVNNEADENRLIEKMKRVLTQEAKNFNLLGA